MSTVRNAAAAALAAAVLAVPVGTTVAVGAIPDVPDPDRVVVAYEVYHLVVSCDGETVTTHFWTTAAADDPTDVRTDEVVTRWWSDWLQQDALGIEPPAGCVYDVAPPAEPAPLPDPEPTPPAAPEAPVEWEPPTASDRPGYVVTVDGYEIPAGEWG